MSKIDVKTNKIEIARENELTSLSSPLMSSNSSIKQNIISLK